MQAIHIHIRDFRSIEEASIDLDGITILSGLNASGKSTVSRLLYYIGHYANDYQDLLKSDLFNEILPTLTFLYQNMVGLDVASFTKFSLILDAIRNPDEVFGLEDEIHSFIGLFRGVFERGVQVKRVDRERLGKLLGREISRRTSYLKALDDLDDRVTEIYKRYNKALIERPIAPLTRCIQSDFPGSGEDPLDHIVVQEGDTTILGQHRKSLGQFASLDNVFYIDTPMITMMPRSQGKDSKEAPLNWRELIPLFYEEERSAIPLSEEVRDILYDLETVSGGSIELPHPQVGVSRQSRSYFISKGGDRFPLTEAATGIKSFALLQCLLRKGLIHKQSVLILDEPEAHLHPQWIVEYARIILRMHHLLGVRFLIASHSPDFIQALYNIANSDQYGEPVTEGLSFYLSEPSEREGTGRYTYRSIGNEIDDIFECFNLSFDKIDHYATGEEDDDE